MVVVVVVVAVVVVVVGEFVGRGKFVLSGNICGGRFGSNFCPGGKRALRSGGGPVSKVFSKFDANAPRGSVGSGGGLAQTILFRSPGFVAMTGSWHAHTWHPSSCVKITQLGNGRGQSDFVNFGHEGSFPQLQLWGQPSAKVSLQFGGQIIRSHNLPLISSLMNF